ncbi:type II toxin-antitoxin system death-on-curing family toxin [Patescibacteria group bacterium]|nr:type II toxin-antitoxin system death-on-curing family toxin [Patescibacteria group bacterium]MBU1931415.1 type II toxin-antitoxin system death-on-curing family toxin [Patescibacteria group bacterium]
MTQVLKITDVERVCFGLARKLMSWHEPIPDFKTRRPGVLESCLLSPLATWGKKSLYPSIYDKAATLFYLMVKNHPFINGNKRVAVTSLLTFLYLNKKWLKVSPERLYKTAFWVAESDSEFKTGTVMAIKDFLRKNTVIRKQVWFSQTSAIRA